MDDKGLAPRYLIDAEVAPALGRAIAPMVARRKCYQCRQADSGDSIQRSRLEDYVEEIAGHCSTTPDYLLPDTPLKEAVFRTILAHRNEPVTAEEVSRELNDRWAMTAHARDINPGVIGRLLENSQYYCIARLSAPVEDEAVEPS